MVLPLMQIGRLGGDFVSEKVLERLFGKEFVEKYQKARAKAERIPEKRLEEIKQFALENMKDAENFSLKYDNLDILLIFAPHNDDLLEVRKTSAGNFRVVGVWYGCESLRGPFISIFCGLEEHAKTIVREAGAPTLVVGKLREDTYEGDKSYNLRCLGVIPLQEDSNIIDAEKDSDDSDIEEIDKEWDMNSILEDDDED